MKLTEAQIKILEDAFSSYPAGYTSSTNFTSMEGIQRQLDALEDENGYICYMSEYDSESMRFKLEKMIPGLDVQQNIMTDYTPEEPTESQRGIKMDPQQVRFEITRMIIDKIPSTNPSLERAITVIDRLANFVLTGDMEEEDDEIIHIECPSYLSNRLNT
jgi:hypothetical protein